jgi:hypothetical protein
MKDIVWLAMMLAMASAPGARAQDPGAPRLPLERSR